MPSLDELTNYLKQQIKAGYSISQLREHLLSLGYDSHIVGQAIDKVYQKEKKILPWKYILIIGLVIFVIAGTSLYFVSQKDEKEEPEHIQISDKIILKPKQKYEEDEVDIFRGDIEERIAQRKEEKEKEKFVVPELPIPKQPEPEISEIEFDQIVSMVRQQPSSQGLITCKKLKVREQNECFKLLALHHNNTVFCKEIQDTGIRDNCYISFAFSEDYAVCDHIVNKYLQLSCRTLGRTARYDENALLSKVLENVSVEDIRRYQNQTIVET